MKIIQPVALILSCFILLLSACSPKVDTGGYIRDGDLKNQVTVGQTTKDQVLTALGSPSAQSSFGDETWYYITDRKEAFAFLRPQVVEQDVTRIEFDSAGVVNKMDSYNKKDGEDITLVKRTTPTEGHTLGFFEQVLGNIGRFNHPSDDTATPGRKTN